MKLTAYVDRNERSDGQISNFHAAMIKKKAKWNVHKFGLIIHLQIMWQANPRLISWPSTSAGLLLGIIFGMVLCILGVVLGILVYQRWVKTTNQQKIRGSNATFPSSRRRPPAKLPAATSTMSTASTAAFLEDPKNNLAKSTHINSANDLNTCDLVQKDTKYHDLDLESAKVMGKEVMVRGDAVECPKSWKDPACQHGVCWWCEHRISFPAVQCSALCWRDLCVLNITETHHVIRVSHDTSSPAHGTEA